jgi:pentatricopeptide repeat protein
VSIQVINSLLLLYTNALRPEQLEADILPLYNKYRMKHDVYTYQNLIKMYLKLRDLDTIMVLWDKIRTKETFKPNQMVLNTVLEAAIR